MVFPLTDTFIHKSNSSISKQRAPLPRCANISKPFFVLCILLLISFFFTVSSLSCISSSWTFLWVSSSLSFSSSTMTLTLCVMPCSSSVFPIKQNARQCKLEENWNTNLRNTVSKEQKGRVSIMSMHENQNTYQDQAASYL